MQKFIEELFKKRSQWVDANRANGFDEGIATLLKELYPDNAHFLYELLQNAEDAEASEVTFKLSAENLCFIHNGRDFEKEDIDGITGIGNTKKKDDLNSIGKFGVGFKAVFSYTNSPYVHCDSASFGITDMVCPINDSRPKGLAAGYTQFDFPFDNPKKPKKDAFTEIQEGLNGFSSATLLFLHNIQTIRWEIAGEPLHYLRRKEDRNGFDALPVFNIESDSLEESIYWLRLSAACKEEPAHPVSIALQLASKKVKKGAFPFSVVPTEEGRLCIFFPADKEQTDLKFHIHAPFVSTVDRASIPYKNRDNISLRDQLAQLLASSLPMLRDAGLLTSKFLEILPNSTDDLGEFYEPFISSVVAEMRENALVPTASGDYALAEELARGPKRIRDFITSEDLQFLSEDEYQQWAVGTFNPRSELFLKELGIPEWSSAELVDVITTKWGGYYEDDDSEWLDQKDTPWLRSLYLCVSDEDISYGLKRCAIVLASDKSFKKPDDIVFKPTGNNLSSVAGISFVHSGILRGDKNEVQKIRTFLESLGVKDLDEKHFIKSLLNKHYKADDEPPPAFEEHIEHVKRFMKYWKQTDDKDVFRGFVVLFSDEDDGSFCSVSDGYLDEPLYPTGLRHVLSDSKYLVSEQYAVLGETFIAFAKALGVQCGLAPQRCMAWYNKLIQVPAGSRETVTSINEDYALPKCLDRPQYTFNISLLVWKMMVSALPRQLQARYRPNQAHGTQCKQSQLVQDLAVKEWVPDKEGNFHKPAEMIREDLAVEFVYDDNNGWLTAIGFGAQIEAEKFEQEKTTQILRNEGIDLSLEDLKVLSEIPTEDLHALMDEYRSRKAAEIHLPHVVRWCSSFVEAGGAVSIAPERSYRKAHAAYQKETQAIQAARRSGYGGLRRSV
ncbi:hypothetical protein PDESU_06169 [Pontiella desulfatans]|uniref:Sacsin/Nov domain-containing protein n=1 Tax=Pontiella desulfatans TaxID=2750659 RepID=A0A6C2UDS6_PONDE|nr:hypothetical protein [Pontiella desulfatans]VGO17571.1 hypothetical protein PDESU_06169 [Pontiella desulfatans]